MGYIAAGHSSADTHGCLRAQVQRYSGAFLMSARKQSAGLRTPSSAFKTGGVYSGSPGGSPLTGAAAAMQSLLGPAGSEQLPADEDDLGELAEDTEFAVEEHAHRCVVPLYHCYSAAA